MVGLGWQQTADQAFSSSMNLRLSHEGPATTSLGKIGLQPRSINEQSDAPSMGGNVRDSVHPAASSHLPSFITAPGETDVLMIVMGIILVLFVLMIGVFYFRLHALPERFAHNKVQFEIVCVLALLAIFTHKNIFWIAGLLLALIDFPNFTGLLKRIAGSTEKIAAKKPGEGAEQMAPGAVTIARQRELSPKAEGAARKPRSV